MRSAKVTKLTLLTFLKFGVTLIHLGHAHTHGGFLKANPALRRERLSEADVQTSLLTEVEATFGEGTASSRVRQVEAVLAPIYAALPKNELGFLGHATVRYALHRLFVQRHGWVIKGLDAAGGHRNSSSSATLLKEQVPAYLQGLFEERLSGRGFGLRELGVLAATIEHLVHSEAIKRLGMAFKVHNFLPTSSMSVQEAEDVLDTYMASYILGENLANMTPSQALELKAMMPDVYLGWNETKAFVHGVRYNTTVFDGSAVQRASGQLDFSLMARVVERIGEQFGSFQNKECHQMKASLLDMEEPGGTGRVRLSDFYKPALDGHWQFQDSVAYLRQLGALDESDAEKPRVIIANYVSSPANCIASSSFYSVCCMDECEGLLGHLEAQIEAPEATSMRISDIVSGLSSSTVHGPRRLPSNLLGRLEDIAAEHGGTVPLHGRLFAQWMHHAFPRECPYPHLSGTTAPQSPDEWLESTGVDSAATDDEMTTHVDKAASGLASGRSKIDSLDEIADLPWSHEEELLVHRPHKQPGTTFLPSVCALFGATMSVAYGLMRNAGGKKTSKLRPPEWADRLSV